MVHSTSTRVNLLIVDAVIELGHVVWLSIMESKMKSAGLSFSSWTKPFLEKENDTSKKIYVVYVAKYFMTSIKGSRKVSLKQVDRGNNA